MKLTDEQRQVFDDLSEGNAGAVFKGYIKQLIGHVVDVRQGNWSNESRKQTAEIIEKYILDRLKRNQEVDKTSEWE